MKIRVSGLFGKQHSWSYTSRSVAKEFYSMGHELYIDSHDGYDLVCKELVERSKLKSNDIDLDLTYTLPKNFKGRFLSDSKVKASIFNYESSILPNVWKNCDRHLDLILPSSNYCKEIFVNAGWDEKKIKVAPLGVDFDYISGANKLKVFDDGKFNFLNISIPHYRKHIDVLIESYYKAFQGRDDVRLILKTSVNTPSHKFECFVPKIIQDIQVKLKFKHFPCLTIVTEKYEKIGSLYKAADCMISTTGSEGFGLTMLESMSAGTLVASTSVTGHKDFVNEKNSVVIPSYIMKADARHQYWRPSKGATIFRPKVSEVSDIMLNIFKNKDKMLEEKLESMTETAKLYSWESCARSILESLES